MSESEKPAEMNYERPDYERIVWLGHWGEDVVRVRIIKMEGCWPYTIVERRGSGEWFRYAMWRLPEIPPAGEIAIEERLMVPLAVFVEGMIDLMGRPEWDDRRPAVSVIPPGLRIVDGMGREVNTVSTTISPPGPVSDR